MALGALALGASATAAVSPARHGAGQSYYVSDAGNDSDTGRSPGQAWRTVERASAQSLQPGDRVLLERGGSWTGSLSLTESGTRRAPVTVAAYGSGREPVVSGGCVSLTGSWITVERVRATGCQDGFFADGGHDVLTHVQADHNMFGIEIGEDAVFDVVSDSTLVDNQVMAANTPGPTDDYGASGVVVHGQRTLIVHNYLAGQVAPSADFGQDGSAVEIYGALDTTVRDNVARDNLTFAELGEAGTARTVFQNNTSRSDLSGASFLITRGPGDEFGPVVGTVASGNDVTNTGAGSYGFWCGGDCTPATLSLTHNVLRAKDYIGYVNGSIGGGDNVYAGGAVSFPPLPGDGFVQALLGNLASAVAL